MQLKTKRKEKLLKNNTADHETLFPLFPFSSNFCFAPPFFSSHPSVTLPLYSKATPLLQPDKIDKKVESLEEEYIKLIEQRLCKVQMENAN